MHQNRMRRVLYTLTLFVLLFAIAVTIETAFFTCYTEIECNTPIESEIIKFVGRMSYDMIQIGWWPAYILEVMLPPFHSLVIQLNLASCQRALKLMGCEVVATPIGQLIILCITIIFLWISLYLFHRLRGLRNTHD